MIRAAAIAFCLWPAAAGALDLALPASAREVLARDSGPDSYALPLGPFADGALPSEEVQGFVTRRVWRLDTRGMTTLQILAPLVQQVQDDGFDLLFSCVASACGGFDFRFETEVMPAPEMHVDLTDYRFAAARREGEDGAEVVTFLVSRSANAGFIQMIAVTPQVIDPVLPAARPETDRGPAVRAPQSPQALDLAAQLRRDGHVVLEGLAFGTGSSDLGEGPFPSLTALAAFLAANPAARVVLVGHTDAEGPLDRNTALSKRRAESVRARLVSGHAVRAAQLSAEGVGFLAPRRSNLTPEGREANRRVDAVILSLE